MWTKSYDRNGDGKQDYADKMYLDNALTSAASCTVGGYNDRRLPTIKELYSLIQFSGAEISPNATSTNGVLPFIDTDYFDIGYGTLGKGFGAGSTERLIDAQVASSTVYVSTTMGGPKTMFGVNFVDGRIKGYPATSRSGKQYYVLYVRGNTAYGILHIKEDYSEAISAIFLG